MILLNVMHDTVNNFCLLQPRHLFQVEEYYERLEIKDGKKIEVKRVYVASDDAKVLSECRRKYPGKN